MGRRMAVGARLFYAPPVWVYSIIESRLQHATELARERTMRQDAPKRCAH